MADYFPQEIILQILHKLPIKSLVSCTCVCKSWHSLIRNPSFISNHLTLNTTTNNNHLLLFRLRSEFDVFKSSKKSDEHYSLRLDNEELDPYMRLDFPFKTSANPCFRVIGCFNGVICLSDDILSYNYTFILWNPLIKKSITLPKPTVTCRPRGIYAASVGFGFDFKTNDYKILRIVHLQIEEAEVIEVELYSLNANYWKSMTCVAPQYEFNERDSLAFVNGVLHWVAFKRMGNGGLRNVVLGFDMSEEVFLEINLPESLADVHPMYMSVTKYGDSSIAVVNRNFYSRDPHRQCHIWVMKEYGVVGSWTKLLSLGEQGDPRVLGFRKSGEVLLHMYGGRIVSCDPQNQGIKDIIYTMEAAAYSFVHGYVESLVLLDNENAVSDMSNGTSDDASDDIQMQLMQAITF